MGEHSDLDGDGFADHVVDLMPPDIPEFDMTVCICGVEED